MNTVERPPVAGLLENTGTGQNWPFVSVILPIRNEENYIEKTINSVFSQDYPANRFEVIVVDGQSGDRTVEVVNKIAACYPGRITLLENPRKIVPTALNLAIKIAKGEFILRVDGHCTLETDYMSKAVECLLRTGADNAGGPMRAINPGFVAQAIALATSSPFGVGGSRFHYSEKEEFVDSVYLGCFRREVFDKIGYFDEELVRNQDDEFNYRLVASGGKILLSPSIKSYYYSRNSYKKLFKQYYQYGYYKVRVMQKIPGMIKPRHLIPALFVASGIGSLGLAAIYPKKLKALPLLILGSYTAAIGTGSVSISFRKGWKYLPVLPVAFGCLHFGYGLGTLKGLWDFRKLWKSSSKQ